MSRLSAPQAARLLRYRALLLAWILCCCWAADTAARATYVSHRLLGQVLEVQTTEGWLTITPYSNTAFEVHYQREGLQQLPSFAIAQDPETVTTELLDLPRQLLFSTPAMSARVQKSPLRISWFKGEDLLLAEEDGFFAYDILRGFRFALQPGEKLIGGGERILGMDRRGQRLPLYNKPHYGYTNESNQMYFGLPAVLSSEKYLLVFDNSARGAMDLGSSDPQVMQFEAVAGRSSYLVVGGDSYPDILAAFTAVTGRQPLPPRWAFGNFASRFGYHSEAELRAVVQRYRELDIPLDAVVLDIFWFGPDVKGHMGNLDWDREAFPTPTAMLRDLAAQGVNTVLISEPFILSSSRRWEEAVSRGVLARNPGGDPKRFDFFFGNTGLIDVFDEDAAGWFWQIYRELIDQGAAGVWGDLGEPEVHPADAIHALGAADAVHNAYGHKWAELVYRNHVQGYPERRPLILMRSGFVGSQRYGMIPWTGDVAREWGGLQSQLELSLQMGLLGLGYIHSDLGGFAGGEVFDAELYLRWLQFGVFQPVFRPHAQEHIPAEPVFHDASVQQQARELIKLRYRLLPYLYTLAWENATSGLPFIRPLFFSDESDLGLLDYQDAFLWGDDFLVSPVTAPGVSEQRVKLPAGVWFDFWRGTRYDGGRDVPLPVSAQAIPVLVRAGAFVPMTGAVATTRDYSSRELVLHYYADESVTDSQGVMYEDDGHTRDANARGLYELLQFSARRTGDALAVSLSRETTGYPGMPAERYITLAVHNWTVDRAAVHVGERPLAFTCAADSDDDCTSYHPVSQQLDIRFRWDGQPLTVRIE